MPSCVPLGDTLAAAFLTGSLLVGSLLVGCGRVVPHGGETSGGQTLNAARARVKPHPLDPVELMPGDLDVVLRLDLASIRDALGQRATEELLQRGIAEAGIDRDVARALGEAQIVWLGTRLADWRAGDRGLVVDLKDRSLARPSPDAWSPQPSGVAGVSRYVATSPAPRGGTAELLDFEHARAFVSPVEAASVRRVLARGPDPRRGDPEARGLLSIDARLERASGTWLRERPSIGTLLRGIERVEAVLEVHSRELAVAARLRCRTERSAERVARFLLAFHEAGAERAQLSALLGKLTVERRDRSVTVRWPIPAAVLFDLMQDHAVAPDAPISSQRALDSDPTR